MNLSSRTLKFIEFRQSSTSCCLGSTARNWQHRRWLWFSLKTLIISANSCTWHCHIDARVPNMLARSPYMRQMKSVCFRPFPICLLQFPYVLSHSPYVLSHFPYVLTHSPYVARFQHFFSPYVQQAPYAEKAPPYDSHMYPICFPYVSVPVVEDGELHL